jgi:lambda family phage minor tail protein L
MTNTIESVSQEFSPGKLVELYVVDLTALGGGVTRWANSAFAENAIVFDGDTYTPMAIEAEGFEWNGRGAIPTPTIRLFPTDGIKAAMLAYDDLIGGKITRIKTFSRFLDGEADANPAERFPDEIYYFEQKTAFNKNVVEWTLSSTLDQEGALLPKRIFTKDICQLEYRRYNPDLSPVGFDYVDEADGGCPYNGVSYFDVDGNSVTIDADQCGKRLSECKRRFGDTAVLPFLAFPGITAFRR